MKKSCFLLFPFCIAFAANAQNIDFPDANFKAKLSEANTTNTIAKNLSGSYFKIDVNNDGEIQQSEAIQVSYLNVQDSNINTITGLDYFTNLQTFGVTNNSLADLPVGNLVQLSRLNCQFNGLQSLDVSNNHNLLVLYCG